MEFIFYVALLMTPVVLGVLLYDRLRREGTEGPSSVERRRFLSRGLAVVPALGAVGVSHGIYTKGRTQLYTTAGVGHWLPFRFGCPPEAPIITLHRA